MRKRKAVPDMVVFEVALAGIFSLERVRTAVLRRVGPEQAVVRLVACRADSSEAFTFPVAN